MTEWIEDDGLTDVTSSFLGLSLPLTEVLDDIHRRGWDVNKISVKDGQYVAEGKNPHGETLEALGRTDATAAANLLVKIMRREFMRAGALREKLGTWNPTTFENQLPQIAQAYAGAPIYEAKAAPAWMELAQDCERRRATIAQQVAIEYTNDPIPYQDANEMREDVTKKKHIMVTRAYAHHPVWNERQMLDFRTVVDVLGHTVGGADWGWHGACLAFASLAPMVSESAQKALFTEMLGQTAYGTIYQGWGPQKICFLEDLIEKAQEKENKPGHSGVHPSQSIIPGVIPKIKTFTHIAAMTRNQLLALAQGLPEDRSEIVHQWPDDWTMRKMQTYGDMLREGELMHNCWSPHQSFPHWNWLNHPQTTVDVDQFDPNQRYQDEFYHFPTHPEALRMPLPTEGDRSELYSLRDPDNIPHVSVDYSGDQSEDAMELGRHNDEPKPEYMERLADWFEKKYSQPYPDFWWRSSSANSTSVGPQTALDPNANWQSGIPPLQDAAFLWQRPNGVDPLDAGSLSESLRPLDTGLANMHPEMGRQAVVNALRSSLLGSRKNPRAHAIHYQSVMNLPAGVDDPMAYHDSLEQQREAWNQGQGYAPGAHKQYWPEEQQFKQWVKATNPQLDDAEVQRTAKREMLHMLSEEEERILANDPGEELTSEQIEHEAYEAIRGRLKAMTKPTVDQKVDFGDEHLFHEAASPNVMYHVAPQSARQYIKGDQMLIAGESPELDEQGVYLFDNLTSAHGFGQRFHPEGYDIWETTVQPEDRKAMRPDPLESGGWMYPTDEYGGLIPQNLRRIAKISTYHADMYPPYLASSLRPIAHVSRHAKRLADAAREDLLSHKGQGHHFRAQALKLGIPNIGPRQISNAWLHLAPKTSQLAVINPDVMETLGHDYQTDASNRDYFKHERELAAGRDASGYNHLPLGAFSAGLFDLKTGGEGYHPDRTPFKPYSPTPHRQVDWTSMAPTYPDWPDPYWWNSTKQARDDVAQDFDRTVAVDHSRDEVPYQRTSARRYYRWLPTSIREDVEQNGMRPNPDTGNRMHFWDNLENAQRYGEISNSIEPHDMWEVNGRPGRLKSDPWFKSVRGYDDFGDKPGAWQSDADHIPPGRIRRYDPSERTSAVLGASGPSPWVVHPQTGQRITGAPGTSLMSHLKQTFGHPSVKEAWEQEYELGKT